MQCRVCGWSSHTLSCLFLPFHIIHIHLDVFFKVAGKHKTHYLTHTASRKCVSMRHIRRWLCVCVWNVLVFCTLSFGCCGNGGSRLPHTYLYASLHWVRMCVTVIAALRRALSIKSIALNIALLALVSLLYLPSMCSQLAAKYIRRVWLYAWLPLIEAQRIEPTLVRVATQPNPSRRFTHTNTHEKS